MNMGIPISQLPELTNADEGDLIPIVDVSGNVTKRVSPEGLAQVVAENLPAGSVSSEALGDSGWIELTVSSPFTASNAPAIRKIGNIVYTKGNFGRTSGFSTSSTTVATIPEGFRPSHQVNLPNTGTYSVPAIFYLTIVSTTGVVSTRQGQESGGVLVNFNTSWISE